LALLAVGVHRDIIHNDLSVAYYNLGNKYRTLLQHELAIEQYDRSIGIDSSYISAYNNRALAIEASGRSLPEMIEAWEGVMKMAKRRGLETYIERATRHIGELERRGPAWK
jgi:tetratricopeptide (TPR) repeat protein